MSQPGDLKACGFLIYRGEPIESFLLMEHADRLDLPKGHVDAGEDELTCALRELREETGIQSSDIRIAPNFRFATQYTVCNQRTKNQPQLKTTVIFLAQLLRDLPIVITEHPGFRWVPWQPPHHIQINTIDPLLAQVEGYFRAAAARQ